MDICSHEYREIEGVFICTYCDRIISTVEWLKLFNSAFELKQTTFGDSKEKE